MKVDLGNPVINGFNIQSAYIKKGEASKVINNIRGEASEEQKQLYPLSNNCLFIRESKRYYCNILSQSNSRFYLFVIYFNEKTAGAEGSLCDDYDYLCVPI